MGNKYIDGCDQILSNNLNPIRDWILPIWLKAVQCLTIIWFILTFSILFIILVALLNKKRSTKEIVLIITILAVILGNKVFIKYIWLLEVKIISTILDIVGISISIVFCANIFTHQLTPSSENNENLQLGWSFWAHIASLVVALLSSRIYETYFSIYLKFYNIFWFW